MFLLLYFAVSMIAINLMTVVKTIGYNTEVDSDQETVTAKL